MRYFAVCYKRIHLFSIVAAVFLLLDISSCSLQRAARPAPETNVSTQQAESEVKKPDALFDPEEHLKAALEARKLGHADKAVPELEKIRENSPGTVWYRRASFLLGLDSMEKGEPNPDYFKDAEGIAHLDDYVLFYQAQALLKKDEPDDAASLLDVLITRFPNSALKAESLYMMAGVLDAEGDYEGAQKAYERFISDHPGSALVPDALLGAARAAFKLKDYDAAIRAARAIRVYYPALPASPGAKALLDDIKAEGETIPEPTDSERFERGRRLFSATRYADAVAEFAALSGKKDGPYRDRAVIKQAIALTRLKRYDKAEKTLRNYINGKGAKRELDALYLLASVAFRQGNEEMLLDTGKKIGRRYPKSAELGRVLLFTGKYYESKDPEKSESFYTRVLDEFKGSPSSSAALDALWDMGWLAYRNGRYDDALELFSSYGQYECRDASKFIYWSGRSAENLGRNKEAADFYGRLCKGFNDSYYCRLSEERLSGLVASGAVEPARAPFVPSADGDRPFYYETKLYATEMPSHLLKVYADDHYLAARGLLIMGLGQRASKEIDFITKKYSSEPKEIFELARMFLQSGDYYNALRVYSLYLSGDRARECGKPSDVLALSFPLQVVDLVKETDPAVFDPYLVAAVMREESSFNPRAVSITGALGLMQIMPKTGRTLARELGEDDFDSKELFDPRTNIRYGSHYLNDLSKLFDNNAILAIASYNAGPNAAARWKDAYRVAPDEFIESIPYPETRLYTKKVLKSYIEFLRLSGVSDPFKRIIRSTGSTASEERDTGVN